MNSISKTFSVLTIVFVTCQAQAGQVVIGSAQDSTIYGASNRQSNSNSKGVGMFAGLDPAAGSAKRAVMAFDVGSSVPAGATITSVTLGLTFGQAAGSGGTLGSGDSTIRTLDLHRLTTGWAEGTSGTGNTAIGGSGQGFAATDGDPTWLARSYSPTTPTLWSTSGGDFVATASATANVGNPNFNQVFEWNSVGMVADVQSWLDSPSTNNGWILKLQNEGQTNSFRAFYTRDATNPDFRPFLRINFVPEPSALLLFALGMSGIIKRRDIKF